MKPNSLKLRGYFSRNSRFIRQFFEASFGDENRETENDIELIADFVMAQKRRENLNLSTRLNGVLSDREQVDTMNRQLQTFQINETEFDQLEIKNFLGSQNSLKELTLVDMNLDFDSTKLIFNELQELEKVHLLDTLFETIHGAHKLKENLKIQEISLTNIEHGSWTNLNKLLHLLPNLTKIRLFCFTRDLLIGIVKILKASAPKLETLELYQCQTTPMEMVKIQKDALIFKIQVISKV
jgi:hypothetical protein